MKRMAVKKRRTGKPRRGPMRDAGYRRWLSNRICAVTILAEREDCRDIFPCDPAHTENNGMGSKGPDSSCVPLCRKHHREYDAGRKAFEKKYGLDMKAIAKEYYAAYGATERRGYE